MTPGPTHSCGTCNACCTYYELMADLNKPSATPCSHWQTGTGCSIYETRPERCRTYDCYWLTNPALDDAWRPDRSGILIRETPDGLIFDLAGPDSALESDLVVTGVASLIEQGVPVFLSILGPMGFGEIKTLLNDRLAAAVQSHSRDRLAHALRSTLAYLRLP